MKIDESGKFIVITVKELKAKCWFKKVLAYYESRGLPHFESIPDRCQIELWDDDLKNLGLTTIN